MSEQAWSAHTVIVRLPPEPQTNDELDRIIQVAAKDIGFDIIVDFADVQVLSKSSLRRLVELRGMLDRSIRRVGFCNISPTIRSVFNTHKMAQFMGTDWDMKISNEQSANPPQGGGIVLANQDRDKTHERRRCVRFDLTKWLRTPALLWYRSSDSDHLETKSPEYYQCTLADVSEGGSLAVIDTRLEPTFRKGEYVILRFSPVACEMPTDFDALIRETHLTADSKHICFGLQFVGLEANTKCRRSLQRLCDSEGRYFETLAYGEPAAASARVASW